VVVSLLDSKLNVPLLFCGTSTFFAGALAYIGFVIADTSIGTGLALVFSGANAIAAVLTSYVALRKGNGKHSKKSEKKMDTDTSNHRRNARRRRIRNTESTV